MTNYQLTKLIEAIAICTDSLLKGIDNRNSHSDIVDIRDDLRTDTGDIIEAINKRIK